jgi:hypothetical protein
LGADFHRCFEGRPDPYRNRNGLLFAPSFKQQSLTSLQGKLIKIDTKVVCHGCYVIFQRAEVAVPRELFEEIQRLIAELWPPSDSASA